MKENYSYKIKLRCIVCGSEDHFDSNEDRSYIKCTNCGKEYFGGYDELVSCNQEQIAEVKELATEEVTKDLQKELDRMLKNAFRAINISKSSSYGSLGLNYINIGACGQRFYLF